MFILEVRGESLCHRHMLYEKCVSRGQGRMTSWGQNVNAASSWVRSLGRGSKALGPSGVIPTGSDRMGIFKQPSELGESLSPKYKFAV